MKAPFAYLAACALLVGACGGEDTEAPDDVDNGDAGPTPVVDAGFPNPGEPGDAGQDAEAPGGAWKPGQKIAASEMWKSGSDGASRDWEKLFGDWRGRPATSTWVNLLFTPWDWLAEPGLRSTLTGDENDTYLVWDAWAGFEGPIALSMSMAGTSEVSQEEYDNNLRRCANGEADPYWKAFARNAKARGRDGSNTIVSLAQEFNGTWFPWNPKTAGMDAWMGCWKKVYAAIHSESDLAVTWVFSATANTTVDGDYAVASVWDAYPGDDYVDVLGLTRYDFETLNKAETTDWRDTCGNDQDICVAAKLAREHGKKLAVVEWSIERGKGGHGDNPNFVQMMFGFFADNRDVLLLENNFNHYGDDGNDWNLYPRQDNNAKSSDKYRELYAP